MRASSNSARSATLTDAKAQRAARCGNGRAAERGADAGGARLLLAAPTAAALRRCGGTSAHCAADLRCAHTGISPAWLGVAALPHLLLIPFVLKMSWWQSGVAGRDSVDGLLCRVLCRAVSAGALFRQERDCMACGYFLCAESGAALLLDDGDDGAAVPGGDDLGGAADCAACARLGSGEFGSRRGGRARTVAAGRIPGAGVCRIHTL